MTYCYARHYFVVFCLSICFSSMLNIASGNSLVDKFPSISDLNDWLVLDDKVYEPSTTSYRINLSNSLNNKVCSVFPWYGKTIIIMIIIIIIVSRSQGPISSVSGVRFPSHVLGSQVPGFHFQGPMVLDPRAPGSWILGLRS